MKEQSIIEVGASRPEWQALEAYAREGIRRLLQQMLEEEVENATAVIWKTLLVAERSFRRLDAPELLSDVAEGVVYVDGDRVKRVSIL